MKTTPSIFAGANLMHKDSSVARSAWRLLFWRKPPPPPPWWQLPLKVLAGALALASVAFLLAEAMSRRPRLSQKEMLMRLEGSHRAASVLPPGHPLYKPPAFTAPTAAIDTPPIVQPVVTAPVAPTAAVDTPPIVQPVVTSPVFQPVIPAPAVQPQETQQVSSEASSSSSREIKLRDGRQVVVAADENAAFAALVAKTAAAARAATSKKGAFSLAVSSGPVARALTSLAQEKDLDFGKFHIFFCSDVIGKLDNFNEAQELWLGALGVPAGQVHVVADLPSQGAAAKYTSDICRQDEEVVGDSPGGLPSVDLMLLSTGDDGRCAGIEPGSSVAKNADAGQVVLFSEDEPQTVMLSLDFMNASEHAIVLASAESGASMVRDALKTGLPPPTLDSCPAGMVKARETTWLVTTASFAQCSSDDGGV